MRMSMTELMVVLLIVIIIFGPKQLPKLGKMVGHSMKSFKKGMEEDASEEEEEESEEEE